MSTPEEAWTIQRLANTLKARVETDFPPTWVRGELVGVKRYPSGHWYFGLRDKTAKVDCMIWRSSASRLKTPLEEGAEVFALGTPNLWEERTSLRFQVVQVMPASEAGAAAQLLERTRKRLLEDGLLDPARKRPLPAYPRRIVVITSVAGAAVHDVITVAKRRWPSIELLVINSAVQGERAATELLEALKMVDRLVDVDCCIIGRGGGAKEDLAAFNDEAVCRAVANCSVPVVAAVGHEVDVTLTDLVADVRAATPSQAAEFALPELAKTVEQVRQLQSNILNHVSTLIHTRQERLQRTRERMGNSLLHRLRTEERRLNNVQSTLPAALERHVREPRERLQSVATRIQPAINGRLSQGTATIQRLAASLHALSPLAVLGRGYAMAQDETGTVLRRKADFLAGARFNLRVADGSVTARTEDK